jgi:hypothetical protein
MGLLGNTENAVSIPDVLSDNKANKPDVITSGLFALLLIRI